MREVETALLDHRPIWSHWECPLWVNQKQTFAALWLRNRRSRGAGAGGVDGAPRL